MKNKSISKILILASLVLSSFNGFSQNYKQAVKSGDDFLQKGNYYNAIAYFEIALKQDSTKNKLLYNYAQALRLNNSNAKAKHYYTKVYSSDSKLEFPESAFWLGAVNKSLGNYDEAKKYWTLAKKRAGSNTKSYEYLKANQEIKSCDFALKNDSTYSVKIEHPGKKINSETSEFAPYPLSIDEIYFSRISPKLNDSDYTAKNIRILLGVKKDNVWDTIQADTNFLNKTYNANTSISADKKRFYFTICNDSSRCDIYVSNYNSGRISSPVYLSINNPVASNTHPFEALIEGKKVLFFSSNRKGGEGKYDIWYSVLTDGEYSEPKNMGSTINSIDNEVTPFYDSKQNTLYFSSDWHLGFGGFDVFKSKGTFSNFETPKNLLKPINTKANDLYYIQYKDTIQGFLASNRLGSYTTEQESCCNDIYSFEHVLPDTTKAEKLPTNSVRLNGVINDSSVAVAKIILNLYFHNDQPNPRTLKTETELTYDETYKSYLALKPDYYINAKTQKEVTELYTQYVEKGRKDLDKFLSLLHTVLQSEKNVFLKLRGFASPLNKSDYNLNLSKRRISSFKNELLSYQGGIFKKYITNEQIKFIEVPFGEFSSKTNVIDDPKDPAAIYSLNAGLERRIEISFEYRP